MPTNDRSHPAPAWTVLAMLCVALASVAAVRNAAYRDEPSLWTETIRRSPGKQRTYHNAGCALAKAGRYDDALRAFDAALALEPDGSVLLHFLHIERGNAYYHLGRYEDAIAAWRRALETSPGNPEVLTNTAVALVKLGRIEEARGHAAAALAAPRPLPETHEVMGEISLLRGEYQAAADQLAAALKMRPDLVDAYLSAALAYEKTGNPSSASAMLRQYLERATDAAGREKARQLAERLGRGADRRQSK
jgi:tetratricopeptide (TPR) repeat protein